jgi:hypothetical protein
MPLAAGLPGHPHRVGDRDRLVRLGARRHLHFGVAGLLDASPYVDAGLPVHVWGCRCHLVTLSFGDRITSFYLRPRWEAFRWSIFFSGGRIYLLSGVCSGAKGLPGMP